MKFKYLFTATAITCALSFGFVSCSSDDDDHFDPNATISTKDLASNSQTKNSKGIVTEKASGIFELRNFQQFELDGNGQIIIEDVEIKEGGKVIRTEKKEKTTAVYYFDIAKNDAAAENNHSISLSGTTKVEVTANTEAGYTLSFIDNIPFADVKASDTFNAIKSNTSGLRKMYWNETIRDISEQGWCDYFADTHEVRPVADRTLILSKDGKALYKIKMNSIYQNETPIDFKNFVFYSIDYQAL